MTDVEVDYVSSGDINADAEGPGYGPWLATLQLMAAFQANVHSVPGLQCGKGDIHDELDFRSISDEGECMIEFEVKAEIWVTSKMKVKCQILALRSTVSISCKALRKELGSGSDATILALRIGLALPTLQLDGGVSETLALRGKGFGPGSDLRGEQQGVRFMVRMGDINVLANFDSVPGLQGGISMMRLEFQAPVR
ncbi:Thiosulfate Sulfurtransferase/Rhodanese-Like Domain-Containing Protein 2 [Manis pentadactyla]|nr:Thiosulfate Sulfurtransferase/Rhodanese-Like Domain-Containing Protein 2 [Manis pentadactyla]